MVLTPQMSNSRSARRARSMACGHLVAERADDCGRRPDPGQTRVEDCLGEGSVLGQEAVAQVDGFGAGLFGRRQQCADVEVGGGRGRSGQRQRLVGQAANGAPASGSA